MARVIRESLRDVRGSVALGTVTAPGGTFDTAEGSAWNLTASRRWRQLRDRIKREAWRRYGLRPPVLLVRVAQRQGRGLDHLHLVWWCLNADHRRRIEVWVQLYREYAGSYGFGFVDDPFHKRRGKGGVMRDMVFARAEVAGIYLGNYLGGGQLERLVEAEDRSWRPYWISPVLMRRSGWCLKRCQWVRQAWRLSNGSWDRRTWWGGELLPAWVSDDELREWVCRVTGWDGVVGSGAWHSRQQLAA